MAGYRGGDNGDSRYTSSLCHSQGSSKVNKLCKQQTRHKAIVRQLLLLSGQSKDLNNPWSLLSRRPSPGSQHSLQWFCSPDTKFRLSARPQIAIISLASSINNRNLASQGHLTLLSGLICYCYLLFHLTFVNKSILTANSAARASDTYLSWNF